MKKWNSYNPLFSRVFLVVALLMLSFFCIEKQLPYSGLFVLLLALLVCTEIYFFIRSKLLFYDKIILSILQNDFSASFKEESKTGDFKNAYLLYDSLKEKQHEQTSKELIYRSILNNIDTSVLILEKETTDWSVFLMNDCFSSLFNVPKVSKWEYLKNYLPSLCQEIESAGFSELKTAINIKIEQQDSQTFILQTSLTKSLNKDYFIILLDSIQRVIEKKEKEAWINLMKIISHELMNSLTPIRSLSQNLLHIVDQKDLNEEDFEDIRESLSTIINRSDHLQFFVENYRKLTMLPTPDKKPTSIKALFDACLKIMSPILKTENIGVINEIDRFKMILIDRNQIEQVIINLITNSVFALKDSVKKEIFLSTTTENNRFFITISDTGKGIEAEIRDKIFQPFFTTRKDGAGIGLTLSKNSIEAHGGYLSCNSNNNKTNFVICLMN